MAKIVYSGKTKKGLEIVIRYPQKGDKKEMWRYINELSKEKTFVRFQGEEILFDEESKYLNNQLKKIADRKSVTLLGFSKNVLVAI